MSLVVSKLKVAQLKSELAARNLSTAGLKAALAERLQNALDNEIITQPASIPPEPTTRTISPSQLAPDPSPSSSPAKRPRSSPSAPIDRRPKKIANRSPAHRSARPSQNQSPELALAQNSPHPDLAPDPTPTQLDPLAGLPATEHSPALALALDSTTQSNELPQSDQSPVLKTPLSPPPPVLPQEPQPNQLDVPQLAHSAVLPAPDRPASPRSSTVLQKSHPSQIDAPELNQFADQPDLDCPASLPPHPAFQEPQPIPIDEAVPQEPQPIQTDEPAPQSIQIDQSVPLESCPSQIHSQQSCQSPVPLSSAPVAEDLPSDTLAPVVIQKVDPKRPDDEDGRGSSGEPNSEPPLDNREGLVQAPSEHTIEVLPKPPSSPPELSSINGPSSRDDPTLDGPPCDKLPGQDKPESLVQTSDKAATPVADLPDPSLPVITDEPAAHLMSTNIHADRLEQRLATVDSSPSTFSKRAPDEADSDRPPATRSVYISNLVRPLTVPQIKKKLAEFGEMETFWIDAIRTHAYATFARRADAVEAYEALHHTTPWPPETGKVLSLLYVPTEQVGRLIAEEEDNANGRVQRGRLTLCSARTTDGWQFELRPINSCGPARPRGLASSTPTSLPPVIGNNDRHVSGPKDDPTQVALCSADDRRIEHDQKLVFNKPEDNPEGGPEKWFRKTKAKPSLFWAPAGSNEKSIN